jgi:hypothetical protein
MRKYLSLPGVLVMAWMLCAIHPAQDSPWGKKVEPVEKGRARAVKSELKTAEGKIGRVDPGAKTLSLIESTTTRTFYWDEGTLMTVAGHSVKPSALIPEARVTVYFLQKDDKNLARSIVIIPPKMMAGGK